MADSGQVLESRGLPADDEKAVENAESKRGTDFCFTRVFCGDKLGQSSREVTNAKALHRAAYFHCVARSRTAACIQQPSVFGQADDPGPIDQDGAR